MNTKTAELGLNATTKQISLSPDRIAREAAQLNAMVAGMNKEAGVEVPKSDVIIPPRLELNRQPARDRAAEKVAAQQPAPIQHPRSPFNPRLLFYTGRLKAGKDFVAAATGATVFGFAEPLYAMRRAFFGEVDKDKYGAREILQLFGQWGRGVVSDKYPLNASRASFTMMVRTLGSRGDFGTWGVDWASFGRNDNIWLDGMLKRVTEYRGQPGNEDKRLACVNVRFRNEHAALTAAGWTHFHVTCSTPTWEARIREAGLDPKAPAMTDTSEQMVINLDQQAAQAASRSPNLKLRCIWNDERVKSWTPGAFHTVQSFLQDLEIFS